MRITILTLAVTAILTGEVFAASPLDNTEVLRILEILTGQPRKTWISSGMISAHHERYRAPLTRNPGEIARQIDQRLQAYLSNPSKPETTEKLQQLRTEAIPFNVRYRFANEYMMSSKETVRFDGNSFYWEIEVDSRVDSVTPGSELAGNYLTREFDLGVNRKRLFVWDGEKYIMYFRPINHATITSNPSGVNGPLTAGVIPWGHGRYSLESILKAEISASEVESDGQSEIRLTVVNRDRMEVFVLDPDKNYSVKSYSDVVENAYMTVHSYSDYQFVGGQWCPGSIIMERYDTSVIPPVLRSHDIWNFSAISSQVPTPPSFDVAYEYDALIEDYRFDGDPLQFRYSAPEEPSAGGINVEELRRNRLELARSAAPKSQNCATLSLRYVCGKLGKIPSWQQLEQLVHGEQKKTSMLEMQQFVEALGLGSFAVETDLVTLRWLGNAQAILHLPEGNHYVVLGKLDENYIRLIDMDSQNFYYRMDVDHFKKIWDRTALVVNSGPLKISGRFTKMNDSQLRRTVGAADCEDCTKEIQSFDIHSCEPAQGGGCTTNWILYTRYGCESASSGSCAEKSMVGSHEQDCILDENLDCVGSGEWTAYDIQACE